MPSVSVESSITTFHDEKGAKDVAYPLPPDYLHKREMAERAAAKRSSTIVARTVHQELAKLYAEQRRDRKAPER